MHQHTHTDKAIHTHKQTDAMDAQTHTRTHTQGQGRRDAIHTSTHAQRHARRLTHRQGGGWACRQAAGQEQTGLGEAERGQKGDKEQQ